MDPQTPQRDPYAPVNLPYLGGYGSPPPAKPAPLKTGAETEKPRAFA